MQKKVIIELSFIVIFGIAIGIVMSVVANTFVQGVNIASEYRGSSTWATFEFRGLTYSYS